MSTNRKHYNKGARVVITTPGSTHFGKVVTVTRRTVETLALCGEDGTTYFRLTIEVVPEHLYTGHVRADREARHAAELARVAEVEADYRARQLAEYRAERAAVGAPYVVLFSDDRETRFESKGNASIYVTHRANRVFGGPFPDVSVNWSSVGAVSPEAALQFAAQLTAAAHFAIEQRRSLEEAAGITV